MKCGGGKEGSHGAGWSENRTCYSQSKRGHWEAVKSRSPWVSLQVLSSERACGLCPIGLQVSEDPSLWLTTVPMELNENVGLTE